MAGGAPFAGVYGNVIRDNFAKGNGLGGVTIHQHFVGDLNGNVIVGNVFIKDNLAPDQDFAGVFDGDTTGILVESGLPAPAWGDRAAAGEDREHRDQRQSHLRQ